MKSAEDEVQNYGYEATFPVLVNVNGRPTYLMSLRSEAGESKSVLKMYAMVDATDYQKVTTVSVDQGLNVLKKQMIAIQGGSDNTASLATEKKQITVMDLRQIINEGNTIYYFKDEQGNRYRMNFSVRYEDILAFLNEGDQVTVEYIESDDISLVQAIS